MAERVNPFLAMANKNNEKNSKDLKENPESPIKYGDEQKPEKVEAEKQTEAPKPTEKIKTTKTPKATKKEKQTKNDDGINYKVNLNGENTKRKGVDLLRKNDQFLSSRSRELGMKIQDYFSLLVIEDMNRIETKGINLNKELIDESITTGKETNRRTVVMEESTFIGIKRNSAKCAMKETQYLNYIIAAEMAREEENGPRKGLYD